MTMQQIPWHFVCKRKLPKPAVQSAHAAQTVVSALTGAMTQKHHARAGNGRKTQDYALKISGPDPARAPSLARL